MRTRYRDWVRSDSFEAVARTLADAHQQKSMSGLLTGRGRWRRSCTSLWPAETTQRKREQPCAQTILCQKRDRRSLRTITTSVLEAQRKLNNTRIESTRHLSEVAVPKRGGHTGKVGVIEDVEELRTELQFSLFRESEVLVQPH